MSLNCLVRTKKPPSGLTPQYSSIWRVEPLDHHDSKKGTWSMGPQTRRLCAAADSRLTCLSHGVK
eukprot:11821692-Prorocentrum_lima.AAC.1